MATVALSRALDNPLAGTVGLCASYLDRSTPVVNTNAAPPPRGFRGMSAHHREAFSHRARLKGLSAGGAP